MANSTRVRSGSGTGSGTVPTATLASAPATGDLLIAYVKAAASTTLAAANGFTKSTDVVQGGTPGAIFWKVADGTETATIQPATVATSKTWGCIIDEWNNAAGFPASPVLSENGQVVASTTSYTTQTLSPAAADGCVIATGYFNTNAARTFSAEAVSGSNVGTVTEVGEQVGAALATASISTTTGNYSGSATLSVATVGGDSIIIFQPSAAATKSPPPFSRPWRIWHSRRAA